MLQQVIGIVQNVVTAGGTLLVVYNGIVALMAWRNHQGNEVSNSLMGVVAGGGIIALAALLSQVNVVA